MTPVSQILIKNQVFDIVELNGKFYISEAINKLISVPDNIDIITGKKEQYYDLHNLIGSSYSDLDQTVYILLLDAFVQVRAAQMLEQNETPYIRLKREMFGIE